MFLRICEHFTHNTGTLANIFIDDGGGDDFEEVGGKGSGDGTGEEGFACTRRAIQ